MKSFKTRIIVWTLSISTFVLVAFGVAIDRTYYQLQLASVDDSLQSLAAPFFHPPDQDRFWNRYEAFLKEGGGGSLRGKVLVIAYSADRSLIRSIGLQIDESLLNELPRAEGELPPRDSIQENEFGPPPFGPNREFAPPLRERGRGMRGNHQDRVSVSEYLFLNTNGESARFALYKRDGYNVAVGATLSETMGDLSRLRLAYLFALPLSLGLLGVGAWFFARKAIEPITKLTEVANEISAADLSVRIEEANEDREFAKLIGVFNSMLDRLDRSFEQARRFSADAAHELKTPLAILQGHLENAIQSVPNGSETQRMLGSLVEETHRLKSITRKLLVLAQADTGKLPINRVEVNLLDLIDEAFEGVEESSEQLKIVWLQRNDITLSCDRSLVLQIFQNLVSNALKYRAADSQEVTVSLFEERGVCVFEIENKCDVINEEQRARLFDRFMRIDTARNREAEGTGLGLSLSREFARAHGGDLTIPKTDDFSKIVFRLELAFE